MGSLGHIWQIASNCDENPIVLYLMNNKMLFHFLEIEIKKKKKEKGEEKQLCLFTS